MGGEKENNWDSFDENQEIVRRMVARRIIVVNFIPNLSDRARVQKVMDAIMVGEGLPPRNPVDEEQKSIAKIYTELTALSTIEEMKKEIESRGYRFLIAPELEAAKKSAIERMMRSAETGNHFLENI